jgi:hypothetical protein
MVGFARASVVSLHAPSLALPLGNYTQAASARQPVLLLRGCARLAQAPRAESRALLSA